MSQPSPPPTVEPATYEADEASPRPLPTPDAPGSEITGDLRQPAEIVPSPDGVVTHETTSLDEVIRSVIMHFPVIRQAAAGRGIASGQVLEASGAFDHKLEAFYESQPLDFYENHRGSFGVKRDTTWGGQTFAGYRLGRGVYEPWYLERETNKGGEFKAGFMAPLVRDRVIDANRAELWQAQIERTRFEALIQMAVIGATRDGSAPAASRRGRMVSSSPSSALSRTTDAGVRIERGASGHPRPVVTRAAMSSVRNDLPTPGSPTRSESLPTANFPGQSHSMGRATTSDIRVITRREVP